MTGYVKVKDASENIGCRESRPSVLTSVATKENFTSVLINGVDPLHVSRHHLDARLLRAVSREKLMVRLQVEHAGSFPRVHGGTFVQMPGDTIGVVGSEKDERKSGQSRISYGCWIKRAYPLVVGGARDREDFRSRDFYDSARNET